MTLGIGIGLIIGVSVTVLVCWIRRRRAEASFQR
jgi:sensor c-di-GMP phosphodiesterase-like protein